MDDLKYLKKHYGENFAHLCRESFSTILENEGLLSKLISDHFAPTHSLYQDIIRSGVQDDFKSFIYSLVTVENRDVPVEREKLSPKELLDKAGYILYDECTTEEDIQSFKKYYVQGEELCTFRGHRLDNCRVWFAVKKNVADIKREHFTRPTRQDEYGTSVISIQFSKGEKSTLSIKNRYNHSVDNPDATFVNNLDNIIFGLTDAFVNTYHIDLVNFGLEDLGIEPYVLDQEGKYYRYNFERDNIYYCEGNVVIENDKAITYDKDRYVLAENYIIDQKEKTVTPYEKDLAPPDAFVESIGKVKDIVITTDSGRKIIKFITEKGGKVELTLGEHNEIIGFVNEDVTEICDYFLSENELCEWVDLPNVTKVGNYFLGSNTDLGKINIPKATVIGNYFLYNNNSLKSIHLPVIETIGNDFIPENILSIKKVYVSNAKTIGNDFLRDAAEIESIDVRNATMIGNDFLVCAKNLKSIDVRSAITIGNNFLLSNQDLESVDFKSAVTIGHNCLMNNRNIKDINVKNVNRFGQRFLYHAVNLEKIDIRSAKDIGDYFLRCAFDLKEIIQPEQLCVGCSNLNLIKTQIKANNGTIRNADEVEEEKEIYECEP